MTIAAAAEIEQRANRKPWQFWRSSVVHQIPDFGVQVLHVDRGVTILPDGQHQVILWFDTEEMMPTLEDIRKNPEWKNQGE